jgi:hypothetical protein
MVASLALAAGPAGAAEVRGQVIDKDGSPAADEKVAVVGRQSVVTDKAGVFIFNLPAGHYVLRVRNHDETVEVPAAGTVEHDIHLQ